MKTSPPAPTFRSSAVARLAQMPVATLRIWEQRYRAVQPATSGAGHRRYSAADVERVLLLRRLTSQGHAIGSIAGLDAVQLQQLADTAPSSTTPRPGAALRLVVVGPALAARLQRPAVATALAQGLPHIEAFDSLAEAVAGRRARRAPDLLLWHAQELRPELPREWRALQRRWQPRRVAVVYRFAGAAALSALAAAGAATLREPADDEALGAWLASFEASRPAPADALPPPPAPEAPTPRRYDDATLTAIAGRASSIACECPRHVAELLMQLASFEAYSAGCSHRDAADAELHAYLQQVAGSSRALFESALERLARHEGLRLRAPGR